MTWTVLFTAKARKQAGKLPACWRDALEFLVEEIKRDGPVRHDWPHYGPIKGSEGCHHCHLNKGKPRYVAVWREVRGEVRVVEIRYAGTHEKARYDKLC